MKTNKKLIISLLILCFVFTVTAGAKLTGAYLLDRVSATTDFSGGTIDCRVIPSSESGAHTVSVENTGTADGYIRASVTAVWQNDAGDTYYKTPGEGVDYAIEFSDAWEKSADGYWYFKQAAKAGDVTDPLILGVTECGSSKPEGYRLHLDVTANIIQAEPDGRPADDAWGVDIW